jgi:hypothetical protein
VQVPPTALAPRPSTTSKKHTRIVQRRTKKPAAMTEVEELIELPPYLGPHCQDQVPAEIILDRLFRVFVVFLKLHHLIGVMKLRMPSPGEESMTAECEDDRDDG